MNDIDRHRRLLDLDQRHVWHPFTQMSVWPDDDPLIIERAEGNDLIDDLGRRFFDGVSSLWVTVHGHRKKKIDDAIRAQLDRVAHSTLLGLASVPSIELAQKLVSIAPEGLTRVFYSDSGSTAVEVALKIAYQYQRQRGRPEKSRFVALSEAYHGDTIGSVSVGGIDLFHATFGGLLFDVDRIPSPNGRSLEDALEPLRTLLEERGKEIAALVIEPLIQGAAGMLVQPQGWLAGASALCKAHDVLLIADEVATGFGRTGTMFAVEHEGVRPDLMCIAKGLTGGYLPLAATLATDEIFSAFLGTVADKKTFFHGHTYTGNPLACAAAIANLALFEEEKTLERMKPVVRKLEVALSRIAELPHVLEVRQRGLMVGIELAADQRRRIEYAYGDRMGHRVCLRARKHGILLRPLGNVVVLMPPLSTTEDEAERLGSAVHAAIREVTGA
jgi:adenosylmethionine-8-amino-7-oxononanoate transaminase